MNISFVVLVQKTVEKKRKKKSRLAAYFFGIKQNEEMTISGLFAELDEEQCLFYTLSCMLVHGELFGDGYQH